MNAQIEVQEFEIDAQVNWKHYYTIYMKATKFSYRRRFRAGMKQLRREAALERKLAAAERTIQAQAKELNRYHRFQADIDMGVIVLEMPREEEA